MRKPDCVGALIRDRHNRVYIQRRSLRRRQLPGAWDIVGGHVEADETLENALAREVAEETGWQLRRIEAVVADWEWIHNGAVRRELDYLVEVNGNLNSPRLEPGKHDRFYWVGYEHTDAVRTKYDAGNDRLWSIIRRAARIRLTRNLRLEPVSASSVDALWRLFAAGVSALDSHAFREEEVAVIAAEQGREWDTSRCYNWIAYERKGHGPAIGYGGLVRRIVRGADQLVLQCAVLSDERWQDSAQEIVKAVLAFARNELGSERVVACVAPPGQWASEIMGRSGMANTGAIEYGGSFVQLHEISFRVGSPDDLKQEVVTGIGQILAVPR